MIRKLLRSRRAKSEAALPAVPAGQRIYAVGDIHGALDALNTVLARIVEDNATRGAAETTVIFLGDLVDRGADSAGVVERLINWAPEGISPRFILGNHEEVFLTAVDGQREALKMFARIGGCETIASYGPSQQDIHAADYDELHRFLAETVPLEHLAFLRGFEDMVIVGDYAFVHAGVRPGVPLARQKRSDLRWIRNPFLDHDEPLEKVIVHGHTITESVEEHPHRIGIDTGAYLNGNLTAMGLEGEDRWVIASKPSVTG